MKNNFIIGLASNVDDKELKLKALSKWLHENFNNVRISKLYNTKALNGIHNDYLNGVASAESTLSIIQLNSLFKKYETDNGRTIESKAKGTIPIDIDIVIFNGDILRPDDFKQEYFKKGYNDIK